MFFLRQKLTISNGPGHVSERIDNKRPTDRRSEVEGGIFPVKPEPADPIFCRTAVVGRPERVGRLV